MDLLDPDVTQSHNPKRLFDLVDPGGNYIKCVAMAHNSISQALVNQQEVVLYFGTGRGPIGAQPGMLYLMKEAAIFTVGGKKLLPSPKKELVVISQTQRHIIGKVFSSTAEIRGLQFALCALYIIKDA